MSDCSQLCQSGRSLKASENCFDVEKRFQKLKMEAEIMRLRDEMRTLREQLDKELVNKKEFHDNAVNATNVSSVSSVASRPKIAAMSAEVVDSNPYR